VGYARDGDHILDLVIAPQAIFADCYKAAALRMHVDNVEVPFGLTPASTTT
jgi:hypothetical protein